VWQLVNFCRARLPPCRKVFRMNTALAAGLYESEIPHRLFSLSVLRLCRFISDRLKPVLLKPNDLRD
jgi:hypothetical protein